jgi:diguanylate cyclase (GGDEF)-like protein
LLVRIAHSLIKVGDLSQMDQFEQLYGTPGTPLRSTVSIPHPQNAALQHNCCRRWISGARGISSTRLTTVVGDLLRGVWGWVRGWRLWTHTSPLGIAWLLTCEFVIAGYIIVRAIQDGMPDEGQWATFVLLSVATVLYLSLTWPAETRNRAARVTREHIDHTGVFAVAAALVLPVSLMAVLVVAIRVVRYRIARKPPMRAIFGSAAILGSCIATQWIAAATHLDAVFTGTGVVPGSHFSVGGDAFGDLGFVVGSVCAACVAYVGVQTVLVGVARVLGGSWSWRGSIGTAKENWEYFGTISLGVLAAQNGSPVTSMFLAGVTVVAIVWTRSSQGEADGHHDALTGLANRGAFELAANKALSDDLKADTTTAFVLLDVDHFKRVNDNHSHAAGDVVLQAVADVLQDQSRWGRDIVGRWGGEEFAVVLPGATLEDAWAIAERMRCAVAALAVPYSRVNGGKTRTISQITVSAGIALSPHHGSTIDALSRLADQALYRSKAGGRNRVTIVEPLAGAAATQPYRVRDGVAVGEDATVAIGA